MIGKTNATVEKNIELTGTATAADVLRNKTFYNTNPELLITGSMPNNGAITKTFSPNSIVQSYTIPKGYHDGSGVVKCNATNAWLAFADQYDAVGDTTYRYSQVYDSKNTTNKKLIALVGVNMYRLAIQQSDDGNSWTYLVTDQTSPTGSNSVRGGAWYITGITTKRYIRARFRGFSNGNYSTLYIIIFEGS